MINISLSDDQLLRLRKLRLYHWRTAMRTREMEIARESVGDHGTATLCHAVVVMHIGFVESLNIFFEDPNDTAIGDDVLQRQLGVLPGESSAQAQG